MGSTPGAVLFVSAGPQVCPGCGWHGESDRVSIEVHTAKAGTSDWTVRGSGRFAPRVCENCGQQIHVLEHVIPVHTADFKCPKCKGDGDLTVRVRALKSHLQDFEFEAVLECEPCNAKTAVRKVIEKVLSVVSVDVGPTGVTVKGAYKPGKE